MPGDLTATKMFGLDISPTTLRRSLKRVWWLAYGELFSNYKSAKVEDYNKLTVTVSMDDNGELQVSACYAGGFVCAVPYEELARADSKADGIVFKEEQD